jgi:hypothetical protein
MDGRDCLPPYPSFAGALPWGGERFDPYADEFSSASEPVMCDHSAPRCNAQ